MKIVVCVKYVPDAQGDRRFADDGTVDRAGTDGILSELDEYAVEEALKLAEADGDSTVTVLTVGPDNATDALRKALQMGATDAVHVVDDALHGSDALGTSTEVVEASLPALVSVTDQINDPRYPSFKGIMAAKKKPVQTWSLADLEIDPSDVGLGASWSAVDAVTARPPRQAGQIVTDDGDGGRKLVEFLAAAKLV